MKKLIKTFLKADPWDVKMPLIMMFFGASALAVSISSKGIIQELMYWFIGFLPILFPLTTLNFVLNNYKGRRKRNLIRRMVFTASLGLLFILIHIIKPEWKHVWLIVVSSGGLGYFIYDYGIQGNLYLILRNKPSKIILNETRFRKVMETNCSRHVFKQYINKLKNGEQKTILLKKFKSFGYKSTHLFPTSEISLFEIIIKNVFKIDFHF